LGQPQIARALRQLRKLRKSEDEPDSPAYIHDRTPLKKDEITTLSLREDFRKDPGLPILIGDDIFIRGIRRGDLLFGPGDPAADVKIDEQALVFTMPFAKEKGIWPRKPPSGSKHSLSASSGGDKSGSTEPLPGSGSSAGIPHSLNGGGRPIEPNGTSIFAAEGLLKEALLQLWEQARKANVEAIGLLSIRMFEAGDAFKLLGALGAISGASKTVRLKGGYMTNQGGEMHFEFTGPVTDAQPVREFVDAQMRAAKEKKLDAEFDLTFQDGFSMKGDAAEKLTERLTKFAAESAYVSATAVVHIAATIEV
jgi:hypothetical protein